MPSKSDGSKLGVYAVVYSNGEVDSLWYHKADAQTYIDQHKSKSPPLFLCDYRYEVN